MKFLLCSHDLYLRRKLCELLAARLHLQMDFASRDARDSRRSDLETAYFGEAALRRLQEAHFDVLLLDMRQFRTPEWRCLRRLAGRLDAPAILALVGEPAQRTRGLSGERSLVDDCHCLPLDADRLLGQLRTLYDSRANCLPVFSSDPVAIPYASAPVCEPRYLSLKRCVLFGASAPRFGATTKA